MKARGFRLKPTVDELVDLMERFEAAIRELGISGLGLGLSIVADCVDALKGDLRVESTLGEVTTFILELPVDRRITMRLDGGVTESASRRAR